MEIKNITNIVLSFNKSENVGTIKFHFETLPFYFKFYIKENKIQPEYKLFHDVLFNSFPDYRKKCVICDKKFASFLDCSEEKEIIDSFFSFFLEHPKLRLTFLLLIS